MILHLMPDEKVISRTIDYFNEALPGENVYIILLPPNGSGNNYVQNESQFIHKVYFGSKSFWDAVGNVSKYRYIILHYLNTDKIRFVNKIRHNGIVWIVWGGDMYDNLLVNRGYDLFAAPNINKYNKKSRAQIVFDRIKKICVDKLRIKAIFKISYLCAAPGDYSILLNYYPEFNHLILKDFFYYPVDDIMRNISLDNSLGNNIIVGNSASPTGNHRLAFELLSKSKIEGRNVVVPVSYGTNKNSIIEAGREVLPSHFVPIEDFLPLDKYNELLTSSRTFIYANYRQEAVGNILIALYIGATVFLSERNPFLKSMKSMGFVIYSLDQLANKIDYRLTKEEMENNANLIKKNYSRERLLSVIKESFGK